MRSRCVGLAGRRVNRRGQLLTCDLLLVIRCCHTCSEASFEHKPAKPRRGRNAVGTRRAGWQVLGDRAKGWIPRNSGSTPVLTASLLTSPDEAAGGRCSTRQAQLPDGNH